MQGFRLRRAKLRVVTIKWVEEMAAAAPAIN
jgi:hypothetical protein